MARKLIKIGYGLRPVAGATFTKANVYEVISVKNTTDHLPGEQLTKEEVDRMCNAQSWEVTLIPLKEEEQS